MVPNFLLLTVLRTCIHTIEKKESLAQKKKAGTEEADDSNSVIGYDDTIITLDESVHETIKNRLQLYCGERSRSFQLDIELDSEGSFFNESYNMRGANDTDFVEKTRALARLLSKQQNARVPAGCLVIMDAVDEDARPVIVCIKAELTDALTTENEDGISKLKKVEKLILGRSEKFFKLGIIYQRPPGEGSAEDPKSEWGAILYDHQFRAKAKPAEYFWKDFLGFSIQGNDKLKGKAFFDNTAAFIEKKFRHDLEAKSRALADLESYVTNAQVLEIDPEEYKLTYLPEEMRDDFHEEVAVDFTHPFTKDTSLLDRKLAKSRFEFPDKIVLMGPKESFTRTKVEVIETQADLDTLRVGEGYTIIRIKGNPDRFLTYDE
jgi:hypothetical protein